MWYDIIKNVAVEMNYSPEVVITISISGDGSQSNSGNLSTHQRLPSAHWLSFGGHPLHEAPELSVQIDNVDYQGIKNAFSLRTLQDIVPIYDASDKHGKTVRNVGGRVVSPMDLDDDNAQRLLLIAIVDNNDRFAYHVGRQKFYRFKLTRSNIYHGFEVERKDVSPQIIGILIPP